MSYELFFDYQLITFDAKSSADRQVTHNHPGHRIVKVDTSCKEEEGSLRNPSGLEDNGTYNVLDPETFCKRFRLIFMSMVS